MQIIKPKVSRAWHNTSRKDIIDYEVLAIAEGDTTLSYRYAKLVAELLNRQRLADEKHKLPWRTMTTWFPSGELDTASDRI